MLKPPSTLIFAMAFTWTAAQETPRTPEQPSRFKAAVEQVVLYAAVYDPEGKLISDLKREDFQVFEDKVEQQVNYFQLDDVPVTIGIVMDSSGSMRGRIDMVTNATAAFLDTNHPDNELFLVEFKTEASLEEDFTRDPFDIRDALDNIIISGGTALYDAIFLAVDKAKTGNELKRALLVFTDGEDKNSYYQIEELQEKVRESDVAIYVVAFLSDDLSEDKGLFGVFKSEKQKVERKIQSIADLSGGKAFFPQKIGELEGIFTTIGQELRNQYRIAYTPTNKAKDGKWRDIDVVVQGARKRGLKVNARKGYYANDPSAEAGPDNL